MSLLEDVFLEDEAGEAQELERIIEGDEYDERARDEQNSNENSEREDEAEEDKRRVDPSSTKSKRVVKNPRFVLNPARLSGPRGISVIPEHFKDFKFKGKGHEKEDLDLVLKKLEHWAYRLYPKFKFEDCLKKIETLGKKRAVAVHLHKIRSDQLITEETVVQKDSSDEEELAAPLPPEEDEFDQLLQQQIELARATPGPGEIRPGFGTPVVDKRSPLMMPKATSSPSISDEQKERMIRNRKLAEERRLARLKAAENGNTVHTVDLTNGNINNTVSTAVIDITNTVNNVQDESRGRKNRSNVINSSDEDDDGMINQAVTVDVHKTSNVNVVDLTEVPRLENITSKRISVSENKKNVDSSDDDDEPMEQVVDLTEVHKLKSTTNNEIDLEITGIQNKKKNDILSFDDGDEQMNEVVTVDAYKSTNEKTIDLTEGFLGQKIQNSNNEIDLETTEILNQNNNDLDSSDDDKDVLFINKAVVVDIHNSNKHNKDENGEKEIVTKHKESNKSINARKENESIDKEAESSVIDSSGINVIDNTAKSDAVTVDAHKSTNENTIDLTEGYLGQKIQNSNNEIDLETTEILNQKNNDLDSSHDDEDVSFINEAVVVDIHNSNRHNKDENGKKEVVTKSKESNKEAESSDIDSSGITVMDNFAKSDVEEGTPFINGQIETANFNVDEDSIMITEKALQNNNDSEITEPNHNSDVPDVENKDSNKKENLKTTHLNTDKENIDSSKVDEVLDDLMDVDFSEDF